MQRTLTFTLSAVLAFSPAVPASAQSDAPRPVKSSVEAVAADVEVLVLDSKGKPVEGLAKGDFRLFVNGKETPIDWLEAPAASAPAAPGSPVAPAAPAAEALTGAVAARRMHSTVFVISDLQTDLRSRNAGLDALQDVRRPDAGRRGSGRVPPRQRRPPSAGFHLGPLRAEEGARQACADASAGVRLPPAGQRRVGGPVASDAPQLLDRPRHRREPPRAQDGRRHGGPDLPDRFRPADRRTGRLGGHGTNGLRHGRPARKSCPVRGHPFDVGKLLFGARPLEFSRRGEGRREPGASRPGDGRRRGPVGPLLAGRKGRDQLHVQPPPAGPRGTPPPR